MKLDDLVKEVSNKTGLTQKDTREFIHTVFDTIAEDVMQGGSVAIKNFGTFACVDVKERAFNNPKSPGEKILKPAHRALKFKIAERLSNF